MTTEVKTYQNEAYNRSVTKGQTPKMTLFMAFYNHVEFFKKVFASIEIQSCKDFEVMICDDGSKPEAVLALQDIYKNSEIPVKHIWHSDRGFYKNEVLNRGILESRGEYLAFIDADCVLHPDFMLDHWQNKKAGHTLAGRRVNMTPWVSKNLDIQKIKSGYLTKNWWWLFITMAWMRDNNSTKGFRVTNPLLLKWLNKKPRGIVGSNFSVFKADIERINGFDMSYHHPGIGEDSDIDFRLSGIGVTPLPMCFQGVQYHLYHKLLTRADVNEEKFHEIKNQKKYITNFGLKELKETISLR